MAYGTKYQTNWGTPHQSGVVYIQEKDYTDSIIDAVELITLSITQDFNGWDTHVIGLVCQIDILNDRADYFELLELLTATERKYKIIVEQFGIPMVRLFEGFLNVEVTQQKYLHKQIIRLVASSYLSKLDVIEPTQFETLQNMTWLNMIIYMLREIGSDSNIRINSALKAHGDTHLDGQTIYNKTGGNTEIFWENNVDRKSCLEVLEAMLTSFNHYLYYWDGYWYIEDYANLWVTSKTYNEYQIGTTYGPTDYGVEVSVTFTPADVHTLQLANQSQLLSINPGYNKVQIRLQLLKYFNLTINDFKNIVNTILTPPIPAIRTWEKKGDIFVSWLYNGNPFNTMQNSILRVLSNVKTTNYVRGLYTTVRATVQPETQLSFKFKFGLPNDFVTYVEEFTLVDGTNIWALKEVPFTGDMADYVFTFRYYIKALTGDAGDDYQYLKYLTVDPPIEGEYETGWHYNVYGEFEQVGFIGGDDYWNKFEEVVIQGSAFDNDNKIAEITVNIPVGEAINQLNFPAIPSERLLGDYDFVFFIGMESIRCVNTEANRAVVTHVGPIYNVYRSLTTSAELAYYGDVFISTSESTEETDVIEGKVNSDFLNKLELDVLFADISNFNYKNAILRGDTLESLTTEWYSLDGTIPVVTRPLLDWLIYYKVRLTNSSKQRLTSDTIVASGMYRPFSLFTESKQSAKKFILTGYVYTPNEDECNVQLDEYDKDTEIIIS